MITVKVKELRTLLEKSQGLLGVKKPFPVTFKTRWGIHTFGMKFPIDVIILDKNHTVVCVSPHLPPNRLFFWNPKYQIVLELPYGTIKQKKMKMGSKIAVTSFTSSHPETVSLPQV